MPKLKEIQGTPEKGLNILCIDGGGVRGLSSLLLLGEIMLRVQRHEGCNTPVKPCDYFDVIAGTGTGAISACMLGRLRMPLEGAIESLEQLMTEIFSSGKKLFGQGAFKTTKLKEAVVKVIREANANASEPFLDKDADQSTCKTMVFAMSKHNVSADLPTIFRSYHANSNSSLQCKIWEVICAAMANPDLFKSIEIGPFKELFVDAGVKCNNPLAHVLAEVKEIYPGREIASIVSLGAGHARTIEAPGSGWSLVHRILPTDFILATKNVATDSERVAEEMASRFREMEGVYFRFNVDQGLQNVKLAEWEKLGQVATHTRSYTNKAETKDRIDTLPHKMVAPRDPESHPGLSPAEPEGFRAGE